MKQCHITHSPVPMPNLFIIGDTVAYEGVKRGGTRSFEITHCETGQRQLQELIEQFETFFDASHEEMCRTYPSKDRLKELFSSFYREAIAQTDQTF
jgi:hypothetical protein